MPHRPPPFLFQMENPVFQQDEDDDDDDVECCDPACSNDSSNLNKISSTSSVSESSSSSNNKQIKESYVTPLSEEDGHKKPEDVVVNFDLHCDRHGGGVLHTEEDHDDQKEMIFGKKKDCGCDGDLEAGLGVGLAAAAATKPPKEKRKKKKKKKSSSKSPARSSSGAGAALNPDEPPPPRMHGHHPPPGLHQQQQPQRPKLELPVLHAKHDPFSRLNFDIVTVGKRRKSHAQIWSK